jgi:hypothetical protein
MFYLSQIGYDRPCDQESMLAIGIYETIFFLSPPYSKSSTIYV